MPALTVCCVLFQGTEQQVAAPSLGVYGPEYVDALYRGVRRHFDGELRFVCLVDQEYGFSEPVESVKLLEPKSGWLTLLEAFRPDLGMDRRLVLGLDTVITGDLTEIAEWDGELCMPRDPFTPELLCNGALIADAGASDWLWALYQQQKDHWPSHWEVAGKPSEMAFLRHHCPSYCNVTDVEFPGQVVSYKAHWLQGDCPDARIVYFHGHPKPHDLLETDSLGSAWRAA